MLLHRCRSRMILGFEFLIVDFEDEVGADLCGYGAQDP